MANHWTGYAQRTKKLEDTFTPKLIRVTKSFRKQFIQDLQTHGEQYARTQLHNVILDKELTPLIQTIYKTAGLLGAKILTDEQKKFIRQGEKAGGFGRNERWIRAVIDFLKLHMLGFVQNITSTMRDDILNVLQKAVDNGWGIAETVRQLQRADLVEARATVIARTEINRAANTGHSIAAKELPYEVDKKWIAAHDHRTRESHRIIDAHQVGENDFFNVPVFKGKIQIGTEEMLYPGDPNASAGNTINCRCRVIYIPKRDALGKLILRQPNQATIIPMRQIPRYSPEQIAAQLKAHVSITVK
jgi:uncharacterized protein with gpF-like domain